VSLGGILFFEGWGHAEVGGLSGSGVAESAPATDWEWGMVQAQIECHPMPVNGRALGRSIASAPIGASQYWPGALAPGELRCGRAGPGLEGCWAEGSTMRWAPSSCS